MLEEAVIRCLGDMTLAKSPERTVRRVLKPDGWNDNEASAIGKHIGLKLNGTVTVDCTEQTGPFGLQVHSAPALAARSRSIRIQET